MDRTTFHVPGYSFGGFRLEVARRRLTGPDGASVPLSGRAWDVLVHLVEQRGRVVGKDELIAAVWPRTVVEDNNLNQAISTLRRALGDSRDAPRFIATVAGRGYQFIGDAIPLAEGAVEADAGAAARSPEMIDTIASEMPPVSATLPSLEMAGASTAVPTPSRRAWIAGLAVAATAASLGMGSWWFLSRQRTRASISIAVLPFRPLLPETRNAAMELGVTEQLINRLSRVPGLNVAPLSSVVPAAAQSGDPRETGRKLGVDAVVDGNLQIHDDRVRLTARLLAVADGAALWANSFTEQRGDLLAVQDSLAVQIANALVTSLSDETRSLVLAQSTSDVEAWKLYAGARFAVERRNAASLRRAIELFEAALLRDPRFALAAAGLSEAHAVTAVLGAEPPVQAWEQARQAAMRAMQLDAKLPAAHLALGHVVTQYDRDLEAGRKLYAQALLLDPRYAHAMAWMALNRIQSGDLANAADLIRKALTLEPASLAFTAQSGWIRYFQRDYEGAERELSRIVASAPEAPLPRQFLARVLLAKGQGPSVVRLLDGRNELAPGAFSNLGRAHAQARNAGAAHAEIERVEALGSRGFGVGFDLALVWLELGERDRALGALERGVDDHSVMQSYVTVEPALDPLRDDPRFRAVSRRLGLG